MYIYNIYSACVCKSVNSEHYRGTVLFVYNLFNDNYFEPQISVEI